MAAVYKKKYLGIAIHPVPTLKNIIKLKLTVEVIEGMVCSRIQLIYAMRSWGLGSSPAHLCNGKLGLGFEPIFCYEWMFSKAAYFLSSFFSFSFLFCFVGVFTILDGKDGGLLVKWEDGIFIYCFLCLRLSFYANGGPIKKVCLCCAGEE